MLFLRKFSGYDVVYLTISGILLCVTSLFLYPVWMSYNKNSNLYVRNVNGTSGPYYANSGSKTESTWLETYRVETGSNRSTCSVVGCMNRDLVGAHVQFQDGRMSRDWQLVPLCHFHNHHSNREDMVLKRNVSTTSLRWLPSTVGLVLLVSQVFCLLIKSTLSISVKCSFWH